jgi:tetratricopeptide (TPR) repeat protein
MIVSPKKSNFFVHVIVSAVLIFPCPQAFSDESVIPPVTDREVAAQDALAKREYAQAELLFQKISEESTNPEIKLNAHKNLATLYIQTQRIAEADTLVQTFKTDFSSTPGITKALYQIGRSYTKNGFNDAALTLHRYNAASTSDLKYAMYSQVEVFNEALNRKDYSLAEASCEILLDRFKNESTLPKEIYQIAQRYGKAEISNKAFDLHRYNAERFRDRYGMWSQVETAYFYIDQRDDGKVAAEFENLLSRFNDQPTVTKEIGNVLKRYAKKDGVSKASSLCEAVLDKDPNHPFAPILTAALIPLYIQQGDIQQAEFQTNRIFEKYSRNEAFPALILDACQAFFQTNDFGKVLALCARAAAVSPSCETLPGFQEVRVRCCLELGAKPQADAITQASLEGLKEDAEFAHVANRFAKQYRVMGDYAKAIELHQNVLSKTTDKIELLCAYAGIAKAQVYASSDVVSDPNSPAISAESVSESQNVDSIVAILVSSYADTKGVGRDVFQIGEEYYFLGEKLIKAGKREQGKEAFARALGIWNRNKALPDRRHAAMAAYYSGVASGYVGDHASALTYYQEVAQAYPEYEKAWHARYMTAECAGKLAAAGKVNRANAAAVQLAAYQDLLLNDPNCPVSSIVRQKVQAIAQ